MREIKFRGWNTITNTMLDLKAITPLAKSSTLVCDGLFLPFTEDIILMQSTGHKDKNGVEIYEGDIVDWYAEELASGGESIIRHHYKKCEVFWHPEFAGLMMRTKDEFGSWHFYEDMKLEVIGNIHQNPELLENK